MDRLPTEAELLQEYGEICHLHETGLQGPFLRAGNLLFRFGSKQSQSSWTIKRVTRYQALLFYWGRKHGHTFHFRRHPGYIPDTPGSEQVFSDILLSEENPAMASALHETHVATNTARSSATAPIVPLTRLIKRPQGKYRSFRQPRRHRAM